MVCKHQNIPKVRSLNNSTGLTKDTGIKIAKALGIPEDTVDSAADQFRRLYQLFTAVRH